jgi:hypothetical protein
MPNINSIGILVPHEKYFAAGHLAKALNAPMFGLKDKIAGIDHLIIIGAMALVMYSKLKKKIFKSVSVIFSDTNFCIHHKWCNEYAKENNIPVYAMPDLDDYLTVPYVPVYQTITIPDNIKIEKYTDKTTICHSPGAKAKYNYKGTKQIGKIIKKFKKYNLRYSLLKNLSWEDCLAEKAKSHIFIDQMVMGNPRIPQKRFGGVVPYSGALGKSGIEAMLLKCCTITSAKEIRTEPYFPPPPAICVSFTEFYSMLKYAVDNVQLAMQDAEIQYAWAKKYCSPEFVVGNVTRHIK